MSEPKKRAGWVRGVISRANSDEAPTHAPVTIQALLDGIKSAQQNVKASFARLAADVDALNHAKQAFADYVKANDLDITCEPDPMTMRTLVQIDEAQT